MRTRLVHKVKYCDFKAAGFVISSRYLLKYHCQPTQDFPISRTSKRVPRSNCPSNCTLIHYTTTQDHTTMVSGGLVLGLGITAAIIVCGSILACWLCVCAQKRRNKAMSSYARGREETERAKRARAPAPPERPDVWRVGTERSQGGEELPPYEANQPPAYGQV